jgi:predicted CXXCH cytochrome family protein
MKKVLAVVVATSVLAVASFASAASIVNSKHNLSSTGTGSFKGTLAGNTSQICVYCHAPHNAKSTLPLWNRSNPVATNFTLYSGVNMASRQVKTGFTTDSTSLFCMSCHDGVTNLGGAVYQVGANIRGASGSPAARAIYGAVTPLTGFGNLGTNLSTTHPVNFPVAATDVQNDLWVTPGLNYMGGGAGSTTTTFPLFATNGGGVRNTNRSLECGSCHAVHDSLYSPFLRFTLDGSKVCLGCHNK